MPIYAFRCAQCGHPFDRLQKMDAPDPARCPVCQGGPVQRQVTAPHVRLAGSGWYETDFKSPEQQRHVVRPDLNPKETNA
jgi:putative FmdB family regulatory protein